MPRGGGLRQWRSARAMAVGWRRGKRPEKSLRGSLVSLREWLDEALGEKRVENDIQGSSLGGCFATYCERERRRRRYVNLQGDAERKGLNQMTFLDDSRTSVQYKGADGVMHSDDCDYHMAFRRRPGPWTRGFHSSFAK